MSDASRRDLLRPWDQPVLCVGLCEPCELDNLVDAELAAIERASEGR
jgi:hypothetical protein